MSVPKSKKRECPALYLSNAKLLAEVSYCYFRRFTKEEKKEKIYVLMDIANKIEFNCQIINSIVLTKVTKSDKQVETREASLNNALILCKILIGEVSSLYKSINLGIIKNPFKSKSDLIKKFTRLVKIIDEEIRILKNLLRSDETKLLERKGGTK